MQLQNTTVTPQSQPQKQYPADETFEIGDDRRPPIFIHSELDDLGLTLWAFRVYCHLVRRVNRETGDAWPSYASIARVCLQSSYPNAKPETLRRKAMEAVAELVDRGLVRKVTTRGPDGSHGHNRYTLTPVAEWAGGGGAYAPPGAYAAPYAAPYAAATQDHPVVQDHPKERLGIKPQPLTECGEDEPQQQQPVAAPADPPIPQDAVTYAWIDVFGETTDKQRAFLSNAVRGHSAAEVLRALALAKGQLEKGKEIARPAAYVKKILTTRMNEIGAGNVKTAATPAPSPATAFDAPATHDAPVDQVAPDLAAARLAAAAADARLAEEAWERAEADAAALAAAAEKRMIERARQNEAAAAKKAAARRDEIAAQIAAAIGNTDLAARMAADFLATKQDVHLQGMRLDMLRIKRNKAGQPLTAQQATAILHGGLLDAMTTPAQVAA